MVLAVSASVLLSASALAAATLPAQAAPANVITLSATPAQMTEPVAAAAPLAITATETDQTATLTFAVTSVPAGPFSFGAQPLDPGTATESLNAAFTAAYSGTVTVTVGDGTPLTITESFTWTATNTIAITPNPGPQTTAFGAAVDLPIVATDDAALPLSYTAVGFPAGLTIGKTTGVIAGKPIAPGDHAVIVTATDSTGSKGTAALTWTVGPENKIVVTARPARPSGPASPSASRSRAPTR